METHQDRKRVLVLRPYCACVDTLQSKVAVFPHAFAEPDPLHSARPKLNGCLRHAENEGVADMEIDILLSNPKVRAQYPWVPIREKHHQ